MSGVPQRTHYEVLAVSSRASRDEIRESYRKLVRLLHPDRAAGASAAERQLMERRMREVTEAWSVLGTEDSRRTYDADLAVRRSSSAGSDAGSNGMEGTPRPASRPTNVDQPNAQEMFRRMEAERKASGKWVDADDDDMVDFTGHGMGVGWRRGPVFVAVAIALGIFIGTAYASTKPAEPGTTSIVVPTTTCMPEATDNC